jgi:hypothetical protein
VVTVGQWLTLWSESRIRLRVTTKRSYRSLIEHYLVPHLGRTTFRPTKQPEREICPVHVRVRKENEGERLKGAT